MTTLKALIFDVDGTLAENERDGHRVAFNRAFRAAGLDWCWSTELYGELLQVAGGKERMRFYLEQYSPAVPHVCNWTAFIADLHRAKTAHYGAILQAGTVGLRPGVRRLIFAARQAGIRLAIATTSRQENAIALLKTTLSPESPNWFEIIAGGDIVPRKKPASDIYHYVLTHLGVPTAQCLAFEDTEHGVVAATGAGLTTVATVNDYTQTQNFSAAALVLSHLGDPEQSFTVLAGDALGKTYFDLGLAASLLQPATVLAVQTSERVRSLASRRPVLSA